MKSLPINAYTATGARAIVLRECRKQGVRIANVTATLRPRAAWLADREVAAFETTDHAGQKNATYDVTFEVRP
jgi:hypothetical protein